MGPDEIIIRPAQPADAGGIARVHVDSWRTTYRGIVPDDVLARLSYEDRERRWHQILFAPGAEQFAFVAKTSTGRVIGFANGGPEREHNAEYPGEISALYLLQEYQRKGIGRRLVGAAAA